MMTMTELIRFWEESGLNLDELTIHRWIREQRIIAVRQSGSNELRVPMESIVPLLVTELRQETIRLREELAFRRSQKSQTDEEEPPF